MNTIDRDSCSREPIHIPGAIQPHGVFLSIDPSNGAILQVSENCEQHLERSPEELLGSCIEALMPAESYGLLRSALQSDDLRKKNPIGLTFHTRAGPNYFDGILHQADGLVILELEPKADAQLIDFASYYHNVHESIYSLQNTRSIDEACAAIVAQVRRLSGYDRVDLYKFDAEWNGNVIAESRAASMDSYLHQRFPAGDIPEQARRLYTLNWVRLIVDANYAPARILPAANPRTGRTLDLSFSTLRSVSPIHCQYLRNMPVQSSMSISVMKEDRLWGLICCHHPEPRFVSYGVRSACELLGQIFSYHLTALESRDDILLRQELRDKVTFIEKGIRDSDNMHAAFEGTADSILSLAQSTGAALILQNKLTTIGQVPGRDVIFDLVKKLRQWIQRDVFSTPKLAESLPGWDAEKNQAAGMLAIQLTDTFDSYIIWFRPEIIQTVHWAGNPKKSLDPHEELTPRKSFELWREHVRGQCLPFEAATVEAALELRNLILLKQLSKVNADLRLSNNELDEFAQIISHDLREPLRGIRSYANFILQDEGKSLSDKTQKRLQSIMHLSQHMDGLTTSLFQYARLGRYHMGTMDSDLNEVLEGVLFRLRSLIDEQKVAISMPKTLPRITCSPVRVGEIFYNLICNGIKYNESAAKEISIRCLNPEESRDAVPVFVVQDNGIGIDPQFHESVFKIFRRLHTQNEYGGGTGAGLAIVKKLVESHHGRIWVDSLPGQGSSFYFTLQAHS
ncbi:MAG TPA: ATP-binding protein [Oligoflexus sp.]|uniref:ATP-binding protein n=1 Tax=Oligoflexus sp. TaxID=1971216 RepID=UPI002D801E0A|nr:ATP-binding protein [Oligoflexus sp.]HET9237055.1 ATP-binding protein [Oligoflexus sp.]